MRFRFTSLCPSDTFRRGANQIDTNQLNEGFNMNVNEQIIRETCAAAEGQGLDTEKFVSMFSHDGYMWDMASGTKFRGKGIGDSIAALASAFPDVHREIFKIHVADNVVIVELAIRGTQRRAEASFGNSSSHG
jgi:hypothetical protein